MSFSASVDKSSVANKEAYTITTTSSVTPHSIDVYMNNQFYDRKLAAYNDNTFALSETGLLGFAYYASGKCITMARNGSNNILRIHDAGAGSYVIDAVGSATNGLGTPLHLTVYQNYAYVLHETVGVEVFRYYLLTGAVTRDLSPSGLAICSYIAQNCTVYSKFFFGSKGFCYIANSILDGPGPNYFTLMQVDIVNLTNYGLMLGDVPNSVTSFAVDSYDNLYLAYGSSGSIAIYGTRLENTFYNINGLPSYNLNGYTNLEYIYVDGFNTLYVVSTVNSSKVIQRYYQPNNYFQLVADSVSQVSLDTPFMIQFSPQNQVLYVANNSNDTIFSLTPVMSASLKYWISPANITLYGNLVNGVTLMDKVKVTQNFTLNVISDSQNPRYQNAGDSWYAYATLLSNRAEYIIRAELYKNSVLVNDTSYVNQRYTTVQTYLYGSTTCGDISYPFDTNDAIICYGSSVTDVLYLTQYYSNNGILYRNTITNIKPYDVFADSMRNFYVLRLDTNTNTYYVSIYNQVLAMTSQFTVDSNSGTGLLPRCITVDDSQNVYVCYDDRVKKYNGAGVFALEILFPSGTVSNRKIQVDKESAFIYVSDNSILGFYKIPVSLGSISSTITLSSPPSSISSFDIDIYNNFHIYDSNDNTVYYSYNNSGTLLQNTTIYNNSIDSTVSRLRLYNHLYAGYITQNSYVYSSPSYNGFFNAFIDFQLTDSETGNITLSGTLPHMSGSNLTDSYIFRNHTYQVNTSSTNISASTNRISLVSATDNQANAILPERISWTKDGVIKKDSLRNYTKSLGINSINDVESIAMDSDNYLYVLNDDSYSIDVYNTNNFTTMNYPVIKSISLYNDEGIARDIFVDQNKNIYAIFDSNDDGRYVCRKYDPNGNILLTLGPYDSPNNVYVDSQSNIYISDSGNDEVIKYNSSGVELRRFEFNNARGIAVDSFFNIYIGNSDEIYKYDFEFNLLSPSPFLSGFSYIYDIYIDSSNNFFITDSNANRVYKYNSAGVQQFYISNMIDRPRATVVDTTGNIYIGNNRLDSVVKYDPTGTTLLKVFKTKEYNGNESFTIDSSGNIYGIDNSYSDLIVKYSNTFNVLKFYTTSDNLNGTFQQIVCDRVTNLLYVYVDNGSNDYIAKFDSELNFIQNYNIPYVDYINIQHIDAHNNLLYILMNDGSGDTIQIYNTTTETTVTSILLSSLYTKIVVDKTNTNTMYILNNYYQVLSRVRYNPSTLVYDTVDLFTSTNYFSMNDIAISDTHLYLATRRIVNQYANNGQPAGENKVYKLLLAGDSYTQTFAYNIYEPNSMAVYNNQLYMNEVLNGTFLRLFANDSQTILRTLCEQDYDGQICSDSTGNIYIINNNNGKMVIKYNASGSLVQKFDTIIGATAICVDSSDNIYIASDRYINNSEDRNQQSYIRIDKFNSSGTLVGSITNTYAANNYYTFINYPLRDRVLGMTSDATYLYVAMVHSPVIRFNRTTLALDESFNLTGNADAGYILYKNNFMYVLNDAVEVSKFQLTSTGGTRLAKLNPGRSCDQFGVDASGKIYIPYNDRIFVYQSDMFNIFSTILSMDTDYIFIGDNGKLYVSEQDDAISVYNPTVNSGYSTFLDVTESGDYEITVRFYDYTYNQNYTVNVNPEPSPETYIEYLERIDLEMIPYAIYDAVLSRNEAQIITFFKANRVIVSKLCNFYQKMKNAHENPRRLNTPFYYNVNWYTKIRYDESQPNVPYLVGYRDMYFMYLYLYNKTVSLNMYYLLEVARKYYRRLLLAQRAISMNQDTSVYYNFDASITNNFLLLNFVNSFFNTNIYNPFSP